MSDLQPEGCRSAPGTALGERHNDTPRLSIAYLPVSILRPTPSNPRTHSPGQIRKIARSLETFGFNVPILIDEAMQILAGHGRILAAKQLGLAEVPVVRLEHLTPAQAKAFMIADNRLTEIAGWDEQLLAETFLELSQADLEFDVSLTGFEVGEIDLIIGAQDDVAAPDVADTLPEPVPGPAVTQPGDAWLLGRHRVYCGNALLAESFAALMGRQKAAVVITDPPYNVPIVGHVSGKGAIRHREFAMAAGEMSREEFIAFLTKALGHATRVSRDGSLHYVCMDWRHAEELLTVGRGVYTELKNICVWAKDNGGMGSLYRSQHELVFVFKHGRQPHRNNVQLGQFGRNRTNVWRYPGVNSFRRQSDEGDLLALHPTVKPVALIADALLDSTARGEIVLDPFLGSGSTLIAAERVGRRCFGMEIDPLYIDVILRRWQAYTGDSAIHEESGNSFDQIASEADHG